MMDFVKIIEFYMAVTKKRALSEDQASELFSAINELRKERDEALAKLSSMESKAADKPAVAVPECFRRLYDHARGIRFGTDWNNGAAARHHRQPLIDAALDCEKWLATAPSHSQQSAPSNWISEEANKAVESTKDWPEWRKDAVINSDAYAVSQQTEGE